MELRSFTPEEEAYLAGVKARKKTPPTEEEQQEARRAFEAMQRALDAAGITEEDIIADLEEMHRARKAARMQTPLNGNSPSNGNRH